ncbi:hypothetical protein PLESTB_001178600 [Pleodorina starrii]|uniref:Uncharacterized protein n=1 Tax=Pleodorina starrii TaxID=330485 RepID=A0A9W6F628_9CHLO|nr:hypothetical protein PLESTM_000254500 [Pleodorina starrii]GLC57061.1 hypothetical protein PLESTB_001178600 [Pleodorina starrii]GLC64894.1 hypothetical protein PLESTF_000218900 [Pleodorina starrii]
MSPVREARPLVHYLPLIPMGCMICMIIGVPIWVHYTAVMLHQVEYSLGVLGPSVTAPELGRVNEALKGTSSAYMLFACALFALGLCRKLLSVEHDLSMLNAKQLAIYRPVNAAVHFVWWLIMIWVVVLMMGCAVFAILTWVGYRAVQQVLANQVAMAPVYGAWTSGYANWTMSQGEISAAGGDLITAMMIKNGWPAAVTCPSTCLNLRLFQFVKADAAQSCVCDSGALRLVLQAARTALDAVPGMMVGIWFMYVFGDFFKTSLACDFINASRDAESGNLLRAGSSGGRGYSKL